MIHWKPAFEWTKPNICIAMHIALDQCHSQIRSGDMGACTSNDLKPRPGILPFCFPGNSAHPPKIGQVPIEFCVKKPCTSTVWIVIAYSCFMIKREKGYHLMEICPWSQVNMLLVQQKIILRKIEPIFRWKIFKMYTDCVFDVSFVHHFWGEGGGLQQHHYHYY